jgi:hypothetical protein
VLSPPQQHYRFAIGDTRMTEQTTEAPKVSRYMSAGYPQACFLPLCGKPFEQTCVRGKDNRFYCSPACAEIGKTIDRSHVEELPTPVPTAIPTPYKKRLFRR